MSNTTDFLALIEARQTPDRKTVTEIMSTIAAHYIPTQHDRRIHSELDLLFDSILVELGGREGGLHGKETLRGGRVLVATGDPGTGKSRAFDKAVRTRPELAPCGTPNLKGPILSMVAPSPATLAGLGNSILAALGYPSTRPIRESHVWPVVQQQLREHGVRILLIDEMQHVEEIATVAEARKIANTVKRLLQDRDWPVWLILVGLPQVERFLKSDGSMKRRIRSIAFEAMEYPLHADAAKDIVRELVALAPGLSCGNLLADQFAGRLIHATTGRFGILIEYVQDAIREALLAKDAVLTAEHFADVYEARTGVADDGQNVFLANRWDLVDTTGATIDEETDHDGRPTGQRQIGTKRGGDTR